MSIASAGAPLVAIHREVPPRDEKLDVALATLAIAGADRVTRGWRMLVGGIKRGEFATATPG